MILSPCAAVAMLLALWTLGLAYASWRLRRRDVASREDRRIAAAERARAAEVARLAEVALAALRS